MPSTPDFEELVPAETLDRILTDSVRPVLGAGDLNAATIVAVARLLMELSGELPGGPASDPGAPADAPPPGPPFPDPEIDRAVYDFAGVFEPETIAAVEETIDRIEERTKAEVVVYTQVVDFPTTEETERHALALIDQWGVGRKGFDDGLAIFFDFEPGRSSGQVQLYAAPGFAATFLTNSERQQIFENDMLPHLRADDWDAAILAAMDRIDEVATPENAARLERGRQLNAVVGLIGAPLILAGLVGWGFFHWRRFGKDPVYLDSPSIYVPAPPPDLTAASGAMVMDGGTSRRALTTAMLDLASRGLIAFREESGHARASAGRSASSSTRRRATKSSRRSERGTSAGPWARPSSSRCAGCDRSGRGNYIEPDELLKFGAAVDDFDAALEKHVVEQGWFAEAPSKVVTRWVVRGVLAIVGGAGTAGSGLPDPDERARPGRRGADRRGCHPAAAVPRDACGHDARRDDPGAACRLSADAQEDHGAVALDGPGRRRRGARVARHARPGGRVGHGARTAGRDREGPRAESR